MSIKFTRALPEQREQIIAFSKVFDHDYLEHVIDRWLITDPGGVYLVWSDQTLIGCCCLSFASDTEGWLQGMRIHQDYRSRGIATKLTSHLVDQGGAEGASVIRLLTKPDNRNALNTAGNAGFSTVTALRRIIFLVDLNPYKNNAKQGSTWRFCTIEELPDLMEFLGRSSTFQSAGRLIFSPGYMYRELTTGCLADLITRKEILVCDGSHKMQALLITAKGSNADHLMLRYLDGSTELISSCLTLLPQWHAEGYRYLSMGLLDDQYLLLENKLISALGSFDSERWSLLERKIN